MLEQAVILVGGRGSRLGELTNSIPKPLMKIGESSFLEFLINEVTRFGFKEVVLLCGYKAERVIEEFDGRVINSANIRCLVEQKAMGTGGALKLAEEHLEEQFILLNGDSYFQMNMLDLTVNFNSDECVGRVCLRSVDDTGRYGSVTLDHDGKITSFSEKANSGKGLINAGIYHLSKSILDHIGGIPCSLETEVFPKLIKDKKLYGKSYSGYFIDIGIPADLLRAQKELTQQRPKAIFFDRDGVLNNDFGYVHKITDFEWIQGAKETIKLFNDDSWLVFVVTNQAGVARGYYEEADVHALHIWMQAELRTCGSHIDAFYYCPHHPEGVVPAFSGRCSSRKPEPGMLLTAAQEWNVDLERSVLIGDKKSDIEAALAAGVEGYLFSGHNLLALASDIVRCT